MESRSMGKLYSLKHRSDSSLDFAGIASVVRALKTAGNQDSCVSALAAPLAQYMNT